MARKPLAALVAGALVLAPSLATAGPMSESYTIAPGGDLVAICRGEALDAMPDVTAPDNIGGVCFRWNGQVDSVKIEFADVVSGDEVGFYFQWYDADGEFLTDPNSADEVTGEPEAIWGTSCSPATIPTLQGARGMKIWLDGPVFGPMDCSSGGIATVGTVTLTTQG